MSKSYPGTSALPHVVLTSVTRDVRRPRISRPALSEIGKALPFATREVLTPSGQGRPPGDGA